MTAVACLRVALDAERTRIAPGDLGPLVAKFTAAYLETRWLWPRQFQPLTQYSFLLTDPRAEELDVRELGRLADELQIKLFGTAAEGEVALLLFQGAPESAAAFSVLSAETLLKALNDPSLLPQGGRLTRVRANEVAVEPPPPAPEPEPEPLAFLPRAVDPPKAQALVGAQGVYFTLRNLFSGDVISATPPNALGHQSLVDGPEHMPRDPVAFDADCIAAAEAFLAQGVSTTLYLPICYSNIVRPSLRDQYQRLLSSLPGECRRQLGAAVYDTPRDPAFGALQQLIAALSPYVANIDLRTADPDFEIEKIPLQAVTSVTLGLSDAEPRVRLAELRRFVERLPLYKRKRIWPAVTNVRSRAEVDACSAGGVPFIAGPAVCRMQLAPIGGRTVPLDELPVLPP